MKVSKNKQINISFYLNLTFMQKINKIKQKYTSICI